MAPQDVFRTLPPSLRAMALAGHYLQSFALMEAKLNDTIGIALKLDDLQTLVVAKNIQLRDKQKILRTLLSLAFMPPEQKDEFDRVLVRIGTLSTQDRNMVAHDLFLASGKGDGIEFVVTKATAKLQFPEHTWSVDETEARCDELDQIGATLLTMQAHFKTADLLRALIKDRDASERILSPSPIAALFGQVAPDQAPPQPPSDQGSPPQETTDAKSPETYRGLLDQSE